jgi:hypothetical protein
MVSEAGKEVAADVNGIAGQGRFDMDRAHSTIVPTADRDPVEVCTFC